MTIERKCITCGKQFFTKPVHVRNGVAKFCSRNCHNINMIGSKRSPEVCAKISKATKGKGNPFYGKKHTPENARKNRLARLGTKHTKETKAKMRASARRGERNHKWKGGRCVDKYIHILKPDHPFCNKRGYICEHRLVVEYFLRRYLKPTERIHHIDENRHNNNPTNLYLFKTNSEHMLYHRWKHKNPSLKITKSNLI